MGKITVYCKIGCPYSEEAAYTLEKTIRPKLEHLSNPNNSIDIIWIEKYGDNVTKIGEKNVNMSKSNFFLKKSSEYGLDEIKNHSTFPLVLYTTSKNEKCYIGGNDKFQKILQDVYDVNSKDDCKNLFKTISDGQKRLFCFLLILLKSKK
jgi:glutaredoxin